MSSLLTIDSPSLSTTLCSMVVERRSSQRRNLPN
jgi:hypothetical protein